MIHDFRCLYAVIQVAGDRTSEGGYAAIAAAAVAPRAAGHQIALVVGPAFAVGLHVVEAQARSVFDAVAAVYAGEPVAEVDGEAFFLADPIHPLPVRVAV